MTKYKLSDLITIRNGKDHKHLSDGAYPVFGSGGLMRYADQYIYDKPSILLPRKGSLGNIQFSNEPFWTVDTLYYTEINSSIADPYFLYNYLSILNLESRNTGTGVPSMTFDSYYDIIVQLPELNKQQEIASILFEIEDKIRLNNQLNDNLESMAKTLYDYWFVQFDFPDKNGSPYKSSGGKMVYNTLLKIEIPEGWKIEIIDKILNRNNKNKKIKSAEYQLNGRIPIIDQSENFISGYTNNTDLLLETSTNVPAIIFGDHTRLVKLINFDFARGADGTQVIYSNNERMPQYLFYFSLLKIDLSNYGYARHFKFLKESRILLPDKQVASNFNKYVKKMYDRILNNQLQNKVLSQLRDFLLPMLMNEQVKVE